MLSAPSLLGTRSQLAALAGAMLLAAAGAGCSAAGAGSSGSGIAAVGAESQYADVIAQIGGRYVHVSAVESNPNTDPHSFEASPSVAEAVSSAELIVENGLGYDGYMEKIEAASPSSSRRVINVQKLLGLAESTPNPHLWYKPATMPTLARALARDLSELQPAHAAYFQANARRFDASLQPWLTALRSFGRRFPGVAVATTEPVGDYMLEAAGVEDLTPFSLQADIMNGTDPAPQDVTLEESLLSSRRVSAFIYNQQVTDSLTQSFLAAAAKQHIPVVGVYETMPAGYHYQSWMLAEITALERAVGQGISTRRL